MNGRKGNIMALSRYEQETIINLNVAEDAAEIYTTDSVWIRKMDKLVEQNPEQFILGRSEQYEGKVTAKRYIFPKRFISIRSRVVKRELTDSQRAEIAERLNRRR